MTEAQICVFRELEKRAEGIPMSEFWLAEIAQQLAGIREEIATLSETTVDQIDYAVNALEGTGRCTIRPWPPQCGAVVDNDRICGRKAHIVNHDTQTFMCLEHSRESINSGRRATAEVIS
jgi:hypothetical protein